MNHQNVGDFQTHWPGSVADKETAAAGCSDSGPARSCLSRPCDASFLSEGAWSQLADSLRLTAREVQVVRGFLNDETESAIAGAHGMSRHTVHTYIRRIYRKLRARTRAGVILRVFAELVAQRIPPCFGTSAACRACRLGFWGAPEHSRADTADTPDNDHLGR